MIQNNKQLHAAWESERSTRLCSGSVSVTLPLVCHLLGLWLGNRLRLCLGICILLGSCLRLALSRCLRLGCSRLGTCLSFTLAISSCLTFGCRGLRRGCLIRLICRTCLRCIGCLVCCLRRLLRFRLIGCNLLQAISNTFCQLTPAVSY